jgi:predicted dienelactone hydrolase
VGRDLLALAGCRFANRIGISSQRAVGGGEFVESSSPHDAPEIRKMNSFARNVGWLVGLLLAGQAHAYEAGWTQIQIAGTAASAPATTVALYYPTAAAPRTIPMGPFTLNVAIQGEPAARVKGLILLSHGIGGTEVGHSTLAQALARSGYLVAALRHPGDNWQDSSLWEQGPARYLDERPRQVSRVLDAMLADPRWKDRIATDARGPRVGAVGHSAGGYTVLALAGATTDLSRIREHCRDEAAEDPVFCGMARSATATAPAPASTSLKDERVRSVVALSPMGVPFTAASLSAVRTRTMIYEAELDRFLVPRFHGEWIARNLPAANLHRVPNAWHFAFMDAPSSPIPTPDGDVAANPPGFDREGFLKGLGSEIAAFFDGTLAGD